MSEQGIVYRLSGQYRRPARRDGDAGYFFADRPKLKPGNYIARFQLFLPQEQPDGAHIAVEVATTESGPLRIIARSRREWDEKLVDGADWILLFFSIGSEGTVEFRCWASKCVDHVHLRALTVKRADRGHLEDWSYASDKYPWPPNHLRNVTIGTTGVCNAQCPHCPTSDSAQIAVAQRYMSDELYEKLITGVAESGLKVTGGIGFGLFAEPLLDPRIVERVELIRKVLGDVRIVIPTNAAAFNPERHQRLAELGTVMSVHVEALDPELYARLMPPLRAERVLPKVEQIARLWGKKAKLAVPLHRDNKAEFTTLRDWWLTLAAGEAIAIPMSNRCSWNAAAPDRMLWPVATSCRQEKAYSLVVDYDGAVLTCCDDFSRNNKIGDLSRASISEIMVNDERRTLFESLKNQNWSKIPYCRKCLNSDGILMRHILSAELNPDDRQTETLSA